MNRKGFAPIIFLLIAAAILVVGGIWYYKSQEAQSSQPSVDQTSQTTCTLDANGLPPDPGAAGMQTLAGIDCDHNGVRDDVQRWIVALGLASSSEKILDQEAIGIQKYILGVPTQTEAVSLTLNNLIISRCLRSMLGANYEKISNGLEAAMWNTPARLKADENTEKQAGAWTTDGLPDGAAACQALH